MCHSSNISAAVPPQNKLQAGMEVRCKESPHGGFEKGKYYPIAIKEGKLCIKWGESESSFWRIQEEHIELYRNTLIHFDLANPRMPETEKAKDDNNGWISVEDEMPNTARLVWVTDGSNVIHATYLINKWNGTYRNVTHWQEMTIPSPPNPTA